MEEESVLLAAEMPINHGGGRSGTDGAVIWSQLGETSMTTSQ